MCIEARGNNDNRPFYWLHGKRQEKRRSYWSRRYGSRIRIDRRIIGSCRSRMTNHRSAKVDESANIGFLWARYYFAWHGFAMLLSCKEKQARRLARSQHWRRSKLSDGSISEIVFLSVMIIAPWKSNVDVCHFSRTAKYFSVTQDLNFSLFRKGKKMCKNNWA